MWRIFRGLPTYGRVPTAGSFRVLDHVAGRALDIVYGRPGHRWRDRRCRDGLPAGEAGRVGDPARGGSAGVGGDGPEPGYVWVHTRRPGPELDLVMTTR